MKILAIIIINIYSLQVVAKAKSVCEALVKASEQFADWPCLGYRVMENGIAQDRFSW